MGIVNQTDEDLLKDFPEFVGADGAVVALFFDGKPVGAAQIVFERSESGGLEEIRPESVAEEIRAENGAESGVEKIRSGSGFGSDLERIRSDFKGKGPKELRRIKKLSLKEGFDGSDIRRFFVRSLVFKLLDGEKWIYSDFKDALLEEIGFSSFENGLRCRSDLVVFKKMCEN
jgi:hypothetical protein